MHSPHVNDWFSYPPIPPHGADTSVPSHRATRRTATRTRPHADDAHPKASPSALLDPAWGMPPSRCRRYRPTTEGLRGQVGRCSCVTLEYADGFDDLITLGSGAVPGVVNWSSATTTALRIQADRYTGDTAGRALSSIAA